MYAAADAVPASVPAFLGKLWILVEDAANNDLIGWDSSGTSFHIFEQGRFAKDVLPYYFKHSNVASFIRQLNMYGFHKMSNIDQGSLKMEKDDMQFSHPYFVRGKKNLLVRIKRKIPMPKLEEKKGPVSELTHVLTEVHALQGKQKNMNSKLESLKT
ncbi:Heat shock factor protein 1 [Lamellibrachia satsuma]|nr:Heat shock factor protein 1 [Lamellibrachia satsuma]